MQCFIIIMIVILFKCCLVRWWQVYSVSRNGQLFVFQCDTELRYLADADTIQRRDVSSSSSDEDVEPEQTKKRKGYWQTLSAGDICWFEAISQHSWGSDIKLD